MDEAFVFLLDGLSFLKQRRLRQKKTNAKQHKKYGYLFGFCREKTSLAEDVFAEINSVVS